MIKRLVLLLLLVQPALCPAQSAPGPSRRPLVFTHVTVIDATGAPARPDMTVIVSGGRINRLGKSGGLHPPKNAQIIDASGKFLIPGLWDMHVHINDTGAWFFPLTLANGVTGVRDMGSAIDQPARWRRLWRGGALMPRVVASGPIVTGPVDDPDPRLIRVRTRTEAGRAVDLLVARGADFIKVHDWLPREAYTGIIARAAARKVPVAGHAPVMLEAAEVAAAGQRSVEHLGHAWGGLLLDCSAEEADLKRELRRLVTAPISVPEIARSMDVARMNRLANSYSAVKARRLATDFARHGTWLTPTISSFAWLAATPIDDRFARDPRLKYLPRKIRSMLRGMIDESASGQSSAAPARARLYDRQLELIRAMREGGVPLLAGTDFASYPLLFPGFSLHDELVKLVEAGLSPMEALQTATYNPAKYLGMLNSSGTVEEGKTADLILLDADPLQDIRHTQQINAVVVRGRLLNRKALDEMLARVETAAARK